MNLGKQYLPKKQVFLTLSIVRGKYSLDQGMVSKEIAFDHLKKHGLFNFLSSIDPFDLKKWGSEFAEYNLIEAEVTLDEYQDILKHQASEQLLDRIYTESFGVTTAKTKAFFAIDAGEIWRFMEWFAEERNMNPNDVEQFIDYQSDKWRRALKEYISTYYQ